MSDRSCWQPVSAWRTVSPPPPGGETADDAGLQIAPLEIEALATIIVRVGQDAAFAQRVCDYLGCDVPGAGCVASGKAADLVWSAPGQWLAVGARADSLDGLADSLDGVAAITDQSDSRAVLRVSGPRARHVLAKGFAIDLHPSAFSAGSSAVTKVAHLSVHIWQVDTAPTFLIAVPRSYSSSFWSWLEAARGPFALPKGDPHRMDRGTTSV